MRTKSLKFVGIAAIFAVALFVNASVNTDKNSQDVVIADLVNTTEANAECAVSTAGSPDGYCYPLTGDCFYHSFYRDCDPTR